MPRRNKRVSTGEQGTQTPIWQEALVGIEFVCLRVSPIYWGFGVPRGDGSAVVVIPGLLGTDLYLSDLRAWLGRIGYTPYFSGIGLNAECPNLLIQYRLRETIETARRETKRRVHLIGHSLGGLMARSAAWQMPDAIASVTTLGSPFLGITAHPSVLQVTKWVRENIHQRHGEEVLPGCYTGECTCAFLDSLHGEIPEHIQQTAIYTKSDGIVDWRVCMTGDPEIDVEVSATHLGLAFSPVVYDILAQRLAKAQETQSTRRRRCA